MMKTTFSIIGLLLAITFGQAQSAAITIDGRFNDWLVAQNSFTDQLESVNGVDLLEFQVTNDEQFLFIRIVLDTELNLKEGDPVAHRIFLDIDTDDDPTTGFAVQDGYGSELSVDFSNRRAFLNISGSVQLQFSDFQARFAPTVTSTEFEIAIARNAVPDGNNALFTSSNIRILFRNVANGDVMPNAGQVFSYTFDETDVPPLIPVDIDKENQNLIRIVAYNTLSDGLEDAGRVAYFGNIIKALKPDVIDFSECNNTSASTVLSLMNSWLPLEDGQSWSILKKEGLITASRWPFLNNWPSLYRQFPTLIDLPDDRYATDLLVINAHLRCCANNSGRQEQADEFIAFMLDAKSTGGIIDLPQNTPFVYAGDLNLVGYSQQLTTILTGDIQDTQTYGMGGFPDWDDTAITDQICIHTDKRMSYTWRNDNSSFPPGRLDFIIFSDAVMSAEKSFGLQTAVMPQDRLDLYDLNSNDAENASDHYPVVVDFLVEQTLNTSATSIGINSIFPNPARDELTISFIKRDHYQIRLTDALGRIVLAKEMNEKNVLLNLDGLTPGIYYLDIKARDSGGTYASRVVVQ